MKADMKVETQGYEYRYTTNKLSHASSYILPPLLTLLPKPKGREKLRILDVGCGNGSLTHVIAQQGYEVVGMEESPSGIEIARQNFHNCQFIQGSIYSPPETILNNSFDVVIAIEVIEHLYYPRELPRLAKHCLKPNGYLIVSTPYHGYLKNLALALLGAMDKHYTALWDGGHVKFFSVNTLSQLLIAEGYTDLKFKFTGRLPYLWKSMLCRCQSPQ